MAKKTTALTDMRRREHTESLKQLPERDLCEMVRAHFESHPALPGEKTLKDQANQVLAQLDAASGSVPEGFKQADGPTPFDTDIMSEEEKAQMAERYADTRIRETPLKEGNYYMKTYLDAAKHEVLNSESANNGNSTTYMHRMDAKLMRHESGDVGVLGKRKDGGYQFIGTLPENFLANNPMAVDSCPAEIQITDYSNNNWNNISVRVVTDTDLMSGDVIDLDDKMLAGLDQSDGLEQ